MILLLVLQALFLLQLGIIWRLGDRLKEAQSLARKSQEEEIVTPGMLRGL